MTRGRDRLVSPAVVRRYVARIDTAGKHGGPATVARVVDEPHVLVRVPLAKLDAIDSADRSRVERYAARPTPFPPILAAYSERSCKRGMQQLFVWNGNHRVSAARLRGDANIAVLVPRSAWRRFKTGVC